MGWSSVGNVLVAAAACLCYPHPWNTGETCKVACQVLK